jgi:1,4-dihydroxy-2-naphthoate octaprenyltransferase
MAFVTASSVFNAFAYTGGDFPLGALGLGWVSLGYSGLGDLFVFLYFGGVATSAPFYLHQPPQATPAQLALPARLAVAMGAVGALGTAIIVVNNLRDRHTDVKANKRTLAVRFGQKFVRCRGGAIYHPFLHSSWHP